MKLIGYPSWLCPASSTCLGVTCAATTLLSSVACPNLPAKLSRIVMSVSTAGEKRSTLSGGAGDCVWVSGSTRIGRFLKGSLKEDLSAGRLRAAPDSEPGVPLTEGQRISKLSVPVHAGGAGEPPVTRASLTRPLQSGILDPALPRSRLVVRRSSGAVATDWWSPFMVMILGINCGRGAQDLKKFQVCAREDNFSTFSDSLVGSVHPKWPIVRYSHPHEIKWAAIKSSLCFLLCHWCISGRATKFIDSECKFVFEEELLQV